MALPWASGRPSRSRVDGRRERRRGTGVLLLRGSVSAVAAWSAKGLVPVHVGELEGWTAVVPGGTSQAQPPYDDALGVLASRPVPGRLRSAVGLFAVDEHAIVTVHPNGFRAIQRWVVWTPGTGVVQPRPLKPGRPSDLLRVVGLRSRSSQGQVRDILLDGDSDATTVLCSLADVLGLPGGALLVGRADPQDLGEHRLVTPRPAAVRRFDDTAAQDARQRAELEEG